MGDMADDVLDFVLDPPDDDEPGGCEVCRGTRLDHDPKTGGLRPCGNCVDEDGCEACDGTGQVWYRFRWKDCRFCRGTGLYCGFCSVLGNCPEHGSVPKT